METYTLEDLTQELLKNKKFKELYSKPNLAQQIALKITEARISKGVSQKKLAKRLKTKQPAISRLESGKSLPSLQTLSKVAKALGTELIPPTFSCLQDTTVKNQNSNNTFFNIVMQNLSQTSVYNPNYQLADTNVDTILSSIPQNNFSI